MLHYFRTKSSLKLNQSQAMNWGFGAGRNGWYHAEDLKWAGENGKYDLNYQTRIFINLHHYENPQYRNYPR